MSFRNAKEFLEQNGLGDHVLEFTVSSATVELAAKALDTEPKNIAKSMAFYGDVKPILIVCAGDHKVNSGKFKKNFGLKAKMIPASELQELVGHEAGGICPFGIHDNVDVYLDESLTLLDVFYPACGSDNSCVRMTKTEIEKLLPKARWIDVCSKIQETL